MTLMKQLLISSAMRVTPSGILMEELALWLGKNVGITHDYTLWVEAYANRPLSKASHNNVA